MRLLDELDKLYHTQSSTTKNVNERTMISLSLMVYHNIVTDAVIDIMDPSILTPTCDWFTLMGKLYHYMNLALQMKTQFTYLEPKYIINTTYDHDHDKHNITEQDKSILHNLSIKEEQFNIEPYLCTIKHEFEKQISSVPEVYAEDNVDDDDVADYLLEIFERLLCPLLKEPENYIIL